MVFINKNLDKLKDIVKTYFKNTHTREWLLTPTLPSSKDLNISLFDLSAHQCSTTATEDNEIHVGSQSVFIPTFVGDKYALYCNYGSFPPLNDKSLEGKLISRRGVVNYSTERQAEACEVSHFQNGYCSILLATNDEYGLQRCCVWTFHEIPQLDSLFQTTEDDCSLLVETPTCQFCATLERKCNCSLEMKYRWMEKASPKPLGSFSNWIQYYGSRKTRTVNTYKVYKNSLILHTSGLKMSRNMTKVDAWDYVTSTYLSSCDMFKINLKTDSYNPFLDAPKIKHVTPSKHSHTNSAFSMSSSKLKADLKNICDFNNKAQMNNFERQQLALSDDHNSVHRQQHQNNQQNWQNHQYNNLVFTQTNLPQAAIHPKNCTQHNPSDIIAFKTDPEPELDIFSSDPQRQQLPPPVINVNQAALFKGRNALQDDNANIVAQVILDSMVINPFQTLPPTSNNNVSIIDSHDTYNQQNQHNQHTPILTLRNNTHVGNSATIVNALPHTNNILTSYARMTISPVFANPSTVVHNIDDKSNMNHLAMTAVTGEKHKRQDQDPQAHKKKIQELDTDTSQQHPKRAKAKSETEFHQNQLVHITDAPQLHVDNDIDADPHADPDGDSGDGKKFQCDICRSFASNKSNLRRHMRLMHDDAKLHYYQCSLCSKQVESKQKLHDHEEAVHRADEKYLCPKCPSCFITKTNLIKHIRIVHEKVTKYNCTLCNRSYYQKSDLIRHCKTREHLENS